MRRHRLLAAPALALLVLVGGCDLIGRPVLTEDFGAPYAVVVGAPAESLDDRATPALTTAGRLFVVVAYVGGCADHLFRLDYALTDEEARLRVVHDDPGDGCEQRVREELLLQVNAAVLARPRIVLATPNGDLPLEVTPEQ